MPWVGHTAVGWFSMEWNKIGGPTNAPRLPPVCRFTFTMLGGRLNRSAVTVES